jgi:Cu/Zn superoxide dismutase
LLTDERYAQYAGRLDKHACDNHAAQTEMRAPGEWLMFVRQFNGPLAAVIVAAVAGCSMMRGLTAAKEDEPKSTAASYGELASLRAVGGSAVFGKIRIIDRGDYASMLLSLMNVPPGEFRIALHETPNCSSSNAFSAGPAWAPAGKSPLDLVPVQRAGSEDRVESSLRVAGLHALGANGVAGRSVVVYAGPKVTEARPGVPNEAIACGVFEPAKPFEF